MKKSGGSKKPIDKAHNDQRKGLAPANDELVTKYLNIFAKFIKSVDFQKLKETVLICDPFIQWANSDIHRTFLL